MCINHLRRGISRWAIIFSSFVTMALGAKNEAAVELSGEASITSWRSPGRTIARPFKLAVRGSNWWVTTYESREKISPTNFHWQNFNVAEGVLARCYYGANVGRLHVNLRAQAAPVACPDQVTQFIWLMLTPSVRADASNRVSLPPVYNPSADVGTNPDLRRRCAVEYLDASRQWPKEIRFYSDGTFNRYANGTNTAVRYGQPYDAGFVEARFETTAVTNWSGFTVPWRVRGELLGPGGANGDLKTNDVIEIKVTAISALPVTIQLPPPPDPNTSITDSRVPVAKNQMIGFYVDDGQWPTIEISREVVEEDNRKRKELGLPPRE
jgi:hypothetical protein